MAGPWEDYAPVAKKASGPWDEYGPAADKGIVARVTDPFRHGAADLVKGEASTLRATGNDGVVAQSLQTAGEMAAPENYTPANVTLNPKTWGDIPKALAESVPSLAQDIAVGGAGAAIGSVVPGIGTVAGGIIGGIGSYGARRYGDLLRNATIGRAGDDSLPATEVDKARALAQVGIGGALSRIGFTGALGSPVTAAGGSVAKQIIPQIGKAAGLQAVTNTAEEGVEQGLIDRKLDLDKLGGAAVMGAATGGATRAVAGVKDASAARRFGDVDIDEAKPVVARLQAAHGDDYRGTPKQDFEAVSKVASDLDVRVKSLTSDPNVSGHLKALQEGNQLDNTREVLTRVQKDIAEGRKPSADDFKVLDDTIGSFPHGKDLLDAMREQVTLGKIKALGNFDEAHGTFTGGVSGTPFAQKFLNPTGKFGVYGDLGAAAWAISGQTLPGLHAMHAFASPMTALAFPATQAGIFGALRAGDALTGNRSPTKQFLNRFGGDDPGPTPSTPRGPSFLDTLNAEKAKQRTIAADSKSQAALAVAVARKAERARIAVERQAEATQAPQATPMAPEGPMPASEAPRGPSVDLPETTSITHRDGVRQQVNGDVRNRMSAVANGVNTRATARREILESAFELPLSKSGLEKLGAGSDGILERVFRTSDQTKAKGMLENFLETLSNADEAIIRHHLRNHTDPATGHTFYSTWE